MGNESDERNTAPGDAEAPGNPSSASSERQCVLSDWQVRRKFKHAVIFGVAGSYNAVNAERWKATITRFVHDPATLLIRGIYNRGPVQGGFPADFYYEPGSRLVVVVDLEGEFVTGFRMSLQQQSALLRSGRLGGGT